MLIFAGPAVDVPTTPDLSPDTRYLELRSIDGLRSFAFSSEARIVRDGVFGLEKPPVEISRARYNGLPGARLSTASDLEREITLPIWIRPGNRHWEAVLDEMRLLRGFVSTRGLDLAETDGSVDLIGHRDDQTRRLRVIYVEGLEGDYGQPDGYPGWRIFALRLLAVDPYAHGATWTTPTIALPSAQPFLRSANTTLALPMRLNTTVALGSAIPVTVGGDVDSPAVVELHGPGTAHITSSSGLDVTIGPLGSSDTFELRTGRRKRAILNGVESLAAWRKVAQSPKWRPLPPGRSSVTIQVTSATTASRARVYGEDLWESLW